MPDYGSTGWAGVLGSTLSGMGGQLEQIKAQRDQDIARQLQERQLQEQEKRNQVDLFLKKIEAIPFDVDVDPELAKEGATLGLGPIFIKDPTSGGIRRAKTLTDKANELELETATVANQKVKFEFDRFIEARDPQLFAKLQTQFPDPSVRRFVAEQMYGIKADPLTEDEVTAEKRRDAQNAASVLAAQVRAGASVEAAGLRSGGTTQTAITPNIIRDLGKARGEAQADPTDPDYSNINWSNLLKLQSPFGSKPSGAQATYETMLSATLSRFPPLAVQHARQLSGQFPNAGVQELMEQAKRIPGFDPGADGAILEPILRLMGRN